MKHIPPPTPPNKPKTSSWLPSSITSGFKARSKPRSLLSLAKWFNNENNYDLVVAATKDLSQATDPRHHFKCHKFVIHTRSATLLNALLDHRIGVHNDAPVVYLPELIDKPDQLGYLLRLCYDDALIDQQEQFQALTELYKHYDMFTLLYALDPRLISDTQRTRHSQLLASDLTRVTPQRDHVTPFSDCHVTIEGTVGVYYSHSIVLQNIATIFESRENEGQHTWVIRARDIHPLLVGQEDKLMPCLDALIKYFYSGALTLNGLDTEQLIGLSLIAAHYSLTGVKERCESRLTSHVTTENACQLLITCHRYELTHLQNIILDIMFNDITLLVDSPEFNHVPVHLVRDHRSGPLNIFHCCLNSFHANRGVRALCELLGTDAVPLLTAVIDGTTLLHRAFTLLRYDACQTLIDMHVIDIEARTEQGLTLLQLVLNSPRVPLNVLCDLLKAGANYSYYSQLDYLTERELLQLLAVIPRLPAEGIVDGQLRKDTSAQHTALKRLIGLYHQHSTQPWMSALWTDELLGQALKCRNFDCVGLLWTHFHRPLHVEQRLRVLDQHHVSIIVQGHEHVIDLRTAHFRVEEQLVSYGFIDDYDYTLHIEQDGQHLSTDAPCYNTSDEFLNLLKFMLIINRAKPEDYDKLFHTSFQKFTQLKITSVHHIEPEALTDYFVDKCNIQ